MKSPFPGMDPYLEQHWGDVHSRLIIYISDALQVLLPEGLVARVEERVFLEPEEGFGRSMYPDVRVVERSPAATAAEPQGGIALAEPLTIHCPAPEPLTEGFVEIIDVGSGNRVVTVIEVLSPSNKAPGDGQKLYLQKQREILQSDANLVEIDLLRAGERVLVVPPRRLPPAYRTLYEICVRRGAKPDILEVYAVTLRQRLPRFRIPLRPTDADIALDLQPLIDQCYGNGRYGLTINYRVDPDPPLGGDDARWAEDILRAAGKR
jgi:Protein of unknown function (DUF4058)